MVGHTSSKAAKPKGVEVKFEKLLLTLIGNQEERGAQKVKGSCYGQLHPYYGAAPEPKAEHLPWKPFCFSCQESRGSEILEIEQ